MLGASLMYVTLFSSNIYMLVTYFFMLHKKHLNVIVVPDICYSKNPTTCTYFFFVCSTFGPISSSDTVSNLTVSQWDHRSSMVGYHDHVSTASSQRVGGGPHLTAAQSATQDMCEVTLFSKTYHPNSCQTSRVDFCVLFLYPAK